MGYRQWRLLGQKDDMSASTSEQLARWTIFLGKWEEALQEEKAGLDHIYTNKPEKLSSIQSYFTGMSDHKLLKVIRYSELFRQNPR